MYNHCPWCGFLHGIGVNSVVVNSVEKEGRTHNMDLQLKRELLKTLIEWRNECLSVANCVNTQEERDSFLSRVNNIELLIEQMERG